MKIIDFYATLDKKFPFNSQEEWDKSGYIDNGFKNEMKNPILSLDVNIDAINFAIENGSNLIISHHPLYIEDTDLNNRDVKEIIELLYSNKISVISLHTNFDRNRYGMNFHILKALECENIHKSHKSDYLWFGELKGINEFDKLIFLLKNKWDIEYIKYINEIDLTNRRKLKIAFSSGSGSKEIYNILKKDDCDIFISSEIKWNIWNQFNYSTKDLCVLEVPHSIEKYFIVTIMKYYKDINFLIFPYKKITIA